MQEAATINWSLWMLGFMSPAVLLGVGHVFIRLRQVERDLRITPVRNEVQEMIDRAGIYSQDKNAISMRLDNHSGHIAQLQKAVTHLEKGQDEISGKLDNIANMIRDKAG